MSRMKKQMKNNNKRLTYLIINCGKVNLTTSFLKGINYKIYILIKLKLEVHDTYLKNEKKTTNFEPTDNTDVINKAYLDEKWLKINGHLSSLEEEDYNEFKLQYNKQSIEENLVQTAVKTTIQLLYDKGFVDNFQNAHVVLKDFLFVTRRDS